MSTLNKTKVGYFIGNGHEKIAQMFFTTDGLCNYTEIAAQNHAAALAKTSGDAVECVTREEAMAWWAEWAPKRAAECAEAAEQAEVALKSAQEALGKLPVNTPATKKLPFVGAVSAAQSVFDAAMKELAVANADAATVVKVEAPVVTPEYQAVLDANQRSLTAQEGLGAANVEMNAANEAKNNLPADATPAQKTAATKRVTAATSALDLATTEYNDALKAGEVAAIAAEGKK